MPFARALADQGAVTPEQIDERLAGVVGIHLTGGDDTRRIYITLHEPGVVTHEVGHAIDDGVGGMIIEGNEATVVRNSDVDSIIIAACKAGTEVLNNYAKLSPSEAFAEWFRAALGVRDVQYDTPDVDPRADAELRAPVITRYVDYLIRSMELTLDHDELAFSDDSQVDIPMEVVTRAQVAIITDLLPEQINMRELYDMRREVLGPDVDLPSGRMFDEGSINPSERRNLVAVSDDFALDL